MNSFPNKIYGKIIAVTGASGFIGHEVCKHLAEGGALVKAIHRSSISLNIKNISEISLDLSNDLADYTFLRDAEVVVHCAGKAHVISNGLQDSALDYEISNVHVTEKLAHKASLFGVKRIVFLSTIGVHGEHLKDGIAIDENTPLSPENIYAQSKLKAEQKLQEISKKTGIEVVIIRPTLVVGPGAPGNLQRLARLINLRLPIPIPNRVNKRSFVSLENLVQLISLCITEQRAAGEIFLASDRDIVSTRQVMQEIAKGSGLRLLTFVVPDAMYKGIARLIGKKNLYEKLFGDLIVNASKAEKVLGWRPKISTLKSFYRASSFN